MVKNGEKMKKFNIAVVGATGLVGSTMLKVLEENNIPINKLYCFASYKSAGKTIKYKSRKIVVEELCEKNIVTKKIDYVLMSAGSGVAKKFAPIFTKIQATVIDNSSAFRQDKNIPLIVPEVNYAPTQSKIIANPNCSTIQCMPPLKALQKTFGLKRVDYTTFQAVSGSGQKGLNDLHANLIGKKSQFYPYTIHNNCLPHIGAFDENGYTEEEVKMVNETRKILSLPSLPISATCVRVPIEYSHSVAVSISTKKRVDLNIAKKALSQMPSIVILDDPQQNIYPLASIAKNTDKIYVGRIRVDLFDEHKLHLFIVADNIRVGAATNAVNILKKLIK